MKTFFRSNSKPWGLKWRSSIWFVTLVVGYGILTDLMVYSIVIPVVPFQLEKLGYHSVSALTAWLLFAYSVALVIFSPISSYLSERYNTRQQPLLWGLLSLMCFLVLFMEAPNFPVMIIARFVQGISSSVIWVVGLALLADTVPPEKVGQQLGLAVTGLAVGTLAAPPIGGVLYDKLGFRAPFIFGIIFTSFDVVGRLLVIERKDALKWGHDPAQTATNTPVDLKEPPPIVPMELKENIGNSPPAVNDGSSKRYKRSEFEVWKFMFRSSRAMVGLTSVFIYGIVYTGLEPTLSLRLQDLYGFDSTKVGIVILASAIAAVFASPISGWISDRFGVEWITVVCLAMTVPWYALMIIRGRLAFFIASFAMSNFMMASVVSPLISELASVVREVEGIGYGHVYGFFNMAFGVGSAVGPLASGQVYSHVKHGWVIILSYGCALLVFCCIINFFYMGERPLATRRRRRSISAAPSDAYAHSNL